LTIEENIPTGTSVSSIIVVDPDFTETFHCSLLDSSNGKFHISNLSLVVVGSINYEWQPSHTITVQCADKGELMFQVPPCWDLQSTSQSHHHDLPA